MGHPLWLHVVLKVQLGGQRGAIVERLATGAQLGAEVGSMGGLVVSPGSPSSWLDSLEQPGAGHSHLILAALPCSLGSLSCR